MTQTSDKRVMVAIDSILNAMETVKALPQTYLNTDLNEFLRDIVQVLRYSVPTDKADLEIEEPNSRVIAKLREKGIQVEDDGMIEEFNGVDKIPYLQFIAKLMRALYSLNLYIKTVGVDNIKQNNEKDESKMSDIVSFGVEYNDAFFELHKFIYENFYFAEGTSSQLAISKINAEIFYGINSILGRWFGTGMTEFGLSVRRGTEAAFSAWITLQTIFPDSEIRNSTPTEDKQGIDFVVMKNGKPTHYVQCKTKIEDEEDSDLEWFKGDNAEELDSLHKYIGKVYKHRYKKMKEASIRLANLSERHGVKWGWMFIKPNYYRSHE